MNAIRKTLAALALGVATGALSAAFCTRVASNQFPQRAEPKGASAASTGAIRQSSLRDAFNTRFGEYLANRSRHRYVLLEEVISDYLRTDPEVCLSLLRSRSALTLVSPGSLASLDTQIDPSDLSAILRIASVCDQRVGDALISDCFRKLISTDPAKALDELQLLPTRLRGDLASELAESWGRRDGPGAADAFYKSNIPWVSGATFVTALAAWAETDLTGAYQHLLSLEKPGLQRDRFVGQFLGTLAGKDPRLGFQLLRDHAADMPVEAASPCQKIYRAMAAQDPDGTLQAALALPTDQLRNRALFGIIFASDPNIPRSVETALEAARQMPDSLTSLGQITWKTSYLAQTSADPFSLAERPGDPYQHKAAVDGITDGLVRGQGIDGLAEVVRKGVSANESEWLDSAGSLILAAKPAGNANKSGGNNWKQLPPDVAGALLDYANANWGLEKVASLKGKLAQ